MLEFHVSLLRSQKKGVVVSGEREKELEEQRC